MEDWLSGDLPSWIAVALVVVVSGLGWVFRPKSAHATFAEWKLSRSPGQPSTVTLSCRAFITSSTGAAAITKVNASLKAGPSTIPLVGLPGNDIGKVYKTGDIAPLSFQAMAVVFPEVPKIWATVVIQFHDGSTRTGKMWFSRDLPVVP